ncbi:polymorphic toxin-type HINT domain-containing protein [Peptostreptococcaceae bacterium AGR-M142]
MSNFKKNNKIISTLLLFVMIFQIGFTSASFASERNEIYTGFVDSPYCDDLSKEDIAMIMELINDPEVQAIMDELFLEFSKDKNRHSRKIKWTQADDVLAGLIDGVKDEVGDLVDGVASIFKVSTYKGIISLCKALVTEEITLKELGKYLVKDALEPFEYVIEHGDEIFSGEEVSDTVVRKFSKNLGKCVLTILASSKLTAKVVDKVDGFGKIAKKFKKVEDKLDDFACFTQGTKVLTDDGLKNIEDIKVNDLVFAKDVENNKKDYKIVKELYQNKVDTILKLNIDGQIINTTLNHPFYKKDIGFVEASKLEVNDVLLNSNDEEVKVLAKEEISFDEGIVVYNLNVEDYHTYYVGSNNVLVHNKCWKNSIIKRNINKVKDDFLKKME